MNAYAFLNHLLNIDAHLNEIIVSLRLSKSFDLSIREMLIVKGLF
jgi:hypothetical protein